MLRRPNPESEKGEVFGTHVGDLGIIVIAGLLTFAWIALLVLPSPFAKLEKAQVAQAKAERQKKIDKAMSTGEVSVGLLPAKEH